MFYEIPADRKGMSAAALRDVALAARKSLRDELRSDEPPTAEDATAYRLSITKLDDEATDEAKIEAEARRLLLDAAAEAAAAAEQASNDDPDPDEVPDDDEVKPDTEASIKAPAVVHTGLGVTTDETPVESSTPLQADQIFPSRLRPQRRAGRRA